MSKKVRDFLFLLFIILFVIITFFVSVHALGYTINWHRPLKAQQIFQRTGMILIDSTPSGADIYLDGVKQRRSFLLDAARSDIVTPTKIKNLPPGEYDLRLEKDGYWPLEKKIKIEAGKSTFAENFVFFKRSLPMSLIMCAPQEASFSPDKNSLILPSSGTILNLKTENKIQIGSSSGAYIQWSQDGSQVLAGKELLQTDSGQSYYNLGQLGENANNFYWDENNRRIYYQAGSSINCLTTGNGEIKTVLSGNDYQTYAAYGDYIYTVEIKDNSYFLRVYNYSSSLLLSSFPLPPGKYRFQSSRGHLNLYEKEQQSLYLINDKQPQQALGKKISGVKGWLWLNSDTLVWYKEFEIYYLNLNNGRQDLLVRVSQAISGIAWSLRKNYLIYADSGRLYILDLKQDPRQPLLLLKADDISDLSLDDKNQVLYFFARIGQQEGIYKLQLQ